LPESQTFGIVVVSVLAAAAEPAARAQTVYKIKVIVQVGVLMDDQIAMEDDSDFFPGAHRDLS
jgi:hypothetical protein